MHNSYVLLSDVIKLLHKDLPSFSVPPSIEHPSSYKDIIRRSLIKEYIDKIEQLPTIDIVEMPNKELMLTPVQSNTKYIVENEYGEKLELPRVTIKLN